MLAGYNAMNTEVECVTMATGVWNEFIWTSDSGTASASEDADVAT